MWYEIESRDLRGSWSSEGLELDRGANAFETREAAEAALASLIDCSDDMRLVYDPDANDGAGDYVERQWRVVAVRDGR